MGFFNEFATGIFVSLFVTLTAFIFIYLKQKKSYWANRKFPSLPSKYLVGNFGPLLLQRENMGALCRTLYNKTTEPFIGIYALTRPVLLLRDTDLIRNVLVRDFNSFYDRGVYLDEERDPLSGHIFALAGDKWKELRSQLSPAFTVGKLRVIFSHVLKCAETLQNLINKSAKNNETVEMKGLAERYTSDVIASVCFGMETNTIEGEDDEFIKITRKVSDPNIKNGIRAMFLFLYPQLANIVRFKLFDQAIEDYVYSQIKKNIEYREKNNIVRKDFFQLLLQIRNGVNLSDNDKNINWSTSVLDDSKKVFSIGKLAAQVWVFVGAGFDTSSTTIALCLYQLAKNKEYQERVHDEIDKVVGRNGGRITYDNITEMKYLSMCVSETLRMYPPLGILNRECTIPYTIPGTNCQLDKGTAVIIPVEGLHYDERFYPEPHIFNPDRFDPDIINSKSFMEMPYLPFGDGPRTCIGMRLGKIQTIAALMMVLQHNNVELAPNCARNLTFSAQTYLLQPIEGINLKLSVR